jgi:hypothetical protein
MGAESQVIFFTEVLDSFFHGGYLEVLLNNPVRYKPWCVNSDS